VIPSLFLVVILAIISLWVLYEKDQKIHHKFTE
jgi:hypothetical protein